MKAAGLVASGAMVSAFTASVIASPNVTAPQILGLAEDYAIPSLGLALVAHLTLLSAALVRRIVQGRTERPALFLFLDALAAGRRPARLLWLIGPPLIFALLLASYNACKQLILPGFGFGAGPYLAAIDRRLFFGHDAWRIAHMLAPGPGAAWLCDRVYAVWFLPMFIGPVLCTIGTGAVELRTRYLIAFTLCWIGLGTVLAALLPAAGPIFFGDLQPYADPFIGLKAALAAARDALGEPHRLATLDAQRMLLARFRDHLLTIGSGISAFPSMHNALAVLFACAGFEIRRWLGWLMTLFAGLVWYASIYLGWHYAVDGIAAAIGTVAIWRLSGVLSAWLLAERQASPATVPAVGALA